jgi:hypothetical protein
MQDIAGTKPLNFHVALPQPPVRPPVTAVSAGADAGSAGTATDGRASGDSRRPGFASAPTDPRNAPPDRFTLAGPSPAFQASILEVERDFRNVLARIEATRAKAEADVVFGTRARDPAEERPPLPVSASPSAEAKRDGRKSLAPAEHDLKAAEPGDKPDARAEATRQQPPPVSTEEQETAATGEVAPEAGPRDPVGETEKAAA